MLDNQLAYNLCFLIVLLGGYRFIWCLKNKKICLKNIHKPSESVDGLKLSILIVLSLIIIVLLLRKNCN